MSLFGTTRTNRLVRVQVRLAGHKQKPPDIIGILWPSTEEFDAVLMHVSRWGGTQ